MPAPTILACYETEPWEEAYLRERLADLDVRATPATLSADTLVLAQEASLLSVFIHSPVTASLLAQMPALRFVATRSTGYDHVDLAACRRGTSQSATCRPTARTPSPSTPSASSSPSPARFIRRTCGLCAATSASRLAWPSI